MRGETGSGIVNKTGQILIRSSVACLLLGIASLGLCAGAKNLSDAELERLDKEIERMRERIARKSRPRIVAADIKFCPDGHDTLKNVPIAYGLPSFDPKDRKASEAAIARFEYWPGGCVVSSDSPTNRVTCTTCGLGYDNQPGAWSGFGPSLSHFKRPFSNLMANFSVPATNVLIAPPSFYQAFNSNRMVFEAVSYQTTEPFADIAERVDAWFRGLKLKPIKHSHTNQIAQAGLPRWTVNWKEMNVNADLSLSQDGQVTTVSVMHSRYGELSQ